MRAEAIEHLSGRLELKSHHLLQHHERHILNRLDKLDNTQAKFNSSLANIQLLLDFLLVVGLCVLTVMVFSSVQKQIIDGPIAIMLVLLFLGIAEVLQSLPSQFGAWGKTDYSAQRISPHNENMAAIKEPNKEVVKSIQITLSQHPNIAISHLKPLHISLNENQWLLISGRSGTGKSTLANLLTGVTDCSENSQSEMSMMVNGNLQVDDSNVAHWYASIAYLTQNNSVLTGTLAYNLSIGLRDITKDRIWQVLKMVELDTWANKLKHGIDTWLGETGDQISGGQARRITLARLLLRDPQLVVLDEPFNGIDALMAARIWDNLSEWLKNRTLVLLSHERPSYLSAEDVIPHLSLD
jgi:ATP-binding cassette subfamily C protein CydC